LEASDWCKFFVIHGTADESNKKCASGKIPIVNTTLFLREFQFKEPPSPSEILKAIWGIGIDIL